MVKNSHMEPPPKGKTVGGLVMYHSPEFKALCERFNIVWGLRTKSITLEIPCSPEGQVIVHQEYAAVDLTETSDAV